MSKNNEKKNSIMTQTKRGRKPAAPTHAGTGYTCGQCARGAYNIEIRDYNGAPFLIYCEHGTQGYSKRVRQFVTYRDCNACQHYQQRQRKGGVL